MENSKKGFWRFLIRHKRWWTFLILVILLCVILILFGQSTSLISFIYAFF